MDKSVTKIAKMFTIVKLTCFLPIKAVIVVVIVSLLP